jgi:hypothetical protein
MPNLTWKGTPMKLSALALTALALAVAAPAHAAAVDWWTITYGATNADQRCEPSPNSPADEVQSHKAIGDEVDLYKRPSGEVDVMFGASPTSEAFDIRFFRDPQACQIAIGASPATVTPPAPTAADIAKWQAEADLAKARQATLAATAAREQAERATAAAKAETARLDAERPLIAAAQAKAEADRTKAFADLAQRQAQAAADARAAEQTRLQDDANNLVHRAHLGDILAQSQLTNLVKQDCPQQLPNEKAMCARFAKALANKNL